MFNVQLAYLGVVLIWATTPLAIHWSNVGVHFMSAASARILLAAALGILIASLLRIRIFQTRSDCIYYAAGALSLFPTMPLVYFAAQTLSSGMISVLFGLFPMMVGLLSHFLLKEQILTLRKIVAIGLACLGLVIINWDQVALDSGAWLGVVAMVLATFINALGTVWLKSLPAVLHPFRQGVGSLLLAAPLFALVALLTAPVPSAELTVKPIVGLIYLAVAGSLLGQILFFYVLRHCGFMEVSLIPLITPAIALILGYVAAGESITERAVWGIVVMFCALLVYQNPFAQTKVGRWCLMCIK